MSDDEAETVTGICGGGCGRRRRPSESATGEGILVDHATPTRTPTAKTAAHADPIGIKNHWNAEATAADAKNAANASSQSIGAWARGTYRTYTTTAPC